MSAEDELKRIEREVNRRSGAKTAISTKKRKESRRIKPRSSFDVILAGCAFLVVGAVGIYWVRQIPDEQAKALQNGLIGGAAGLIVGYATGRLRP